MHASIVDAPPPYVHVSESFCVPLGLAQLQGLAPKRYCSAHLVGWLMLSTLLMHHAKQHG
jgi:hypothetical protein